MFHLLQYFILINIFYFGTGHRHNHRHKNHHLEQKSSISTKELRKISEELFDFLPGDLFQSLYINYQEKRYAKDAKDEAPESLLIISRDCFETIPTIYQLHMLYDNYDINSQYGEVITPREQMEENNFIEKLLDTEILIHVMDFLANKGYFEKNLDDYRRVLKKIWFQPYSRTNSTELGSSGFEHVFLVEEKRNRYLTGLHNWIFLAVEEYENRANYLGYIAKKELAKKAAVVKLYFSYLEKVKLSSMFVGTPPEFDIAIYTLCFYARPNKGCKLTLGNEKITIQTWVKQTDNGDVVASSFPII